MGWKLLRKQQGSALRTWAKTLNLFDLGFGVKDSMILSHMVLHYTILCWIMLIR